MKPIVNFNLTVGTDTTLSLSISDKEITLNGVRYIPDYTQPNKIKIYLMRDNHTFINVEGNTPKVILTNLKKYKLSDPDADTGTIHLLHDKKEIKRYNFSTINLKEVEDLLHLPEIHSILLANQ